MQKNIGASIKSDLMPFSKKTRELIDKKIVNLNLLLSSGDDYQLIFTSHSKNSLKIKRIAMKNNIKITKVGKIIDKKGVYLDNKKIKITNKSFQHFA
jgi:Thiamine monophosphate kinase